MSKITKLLEQYSVELIIEEPVMMSPKETGLPFPIGLCTRPNLKVHDRQTGQSASISIVEPIEVTKGVVPGELWKLLGRYIELNQDLLYEYWDGKISAKQYGKKQGLLHGIYRLVQDGSSPNWHMEMETTTSN